MHHPNLETALRDLTEAICSVTLGGIQHAVIDAAGRELIASWNDHNSDDPLGPIDEGAELEAWAEFRVEMCKE